MVKSISLCAAVLLAGCTATAPQGLSPLADDRQVLNAEAAPLADMAAEAHWNDPFAPFKVVGNIYYVGTTGVSAWLITTPRGHFLLDGALPQTPPQIIANIQALGFDIRDVKYLLNSHAHFDHAGGLAALQRAAGATMVASAADRAVLESGRVGYGPTADISVPPVRVDRLVGQGDTLSLGGVTLTAHLTPGHTPGCTSWSMDVRGDDGELHHVFFHCSTTTGGQSLVPESYPGMIASYRATFAYIRNVKADIFLANHANFFNLADKRARQIAGDSDAFVSSTALADFNAQSERDFDAELARQQAAASQ
ncbi:metallo-beta-lactamase L1 [Asticcacaulis biprosthecium C19]|uniref:Metallo-beta-lactamase L1 n=1 Tax=Asticcacaulis biprosthecium C19 TaxID=715226 RepID=F4QTI2_9CAUL|nr:subclass B3 metallo-beta-lactamase [Asticcacaulis biprosthecium]EGF90052.1 metallo-beta-lactamase L1 [Asticcacaulis biprosthecium C19]